MTRYRFADCELDTATRELRRDGVVRPQEPQVFDLLAFLAANPDRVVERDELVEVVWGGRIVSDATIASRLAAARRAVGDDGTRQAVIRTVRRRGVRLVVRPSRVEHEPAHAKGAGAGVRFCRGHGGVRLAWTVAGEGPPLLRVGHWLTHLQHDAASPIWRPFLAELHHAFRLVRYDQRANGLSERGVADLSLAAFVGDLAAVADAAGLERFPIYATSQGVPVALAYAARHPERVTRLVLHGGYVRGRLIRSDVAREEGEAYLALMRHGWGLAGSQFLQAFASIFLPDGTPEQLRSLVELQRVSANVEDAVRLRRAFDGFDVSRFVPAVMARTLVMHGRDDAVHPLEESTALTEALPAAELVVLDTRNHVLTTHDPSWPVFFDALTRFCRDAEGG